MEYDENIDNYINHTIKSFLLNNPEIIEGSIIIDCTGDNKTLLDCGTSMQISYGWGSDSVGEANCREISIYIDWPYFFHVPAYLPGDFDCIKVNFKRRNADEH